MGSVDVFTAARTAEIEAQTIISGLVDVDGHLLLKKHNGATVDAGKVVPPNLADADLTTKGIVELATVTETSTGTDETRAVTPKGLKAVVDPIVASRMVGTIDPYWTSGKPKVTLSDATVVDVFVSSRTGEIRPGDKVLCEKVGGFWYIVGVTETAGLQWTNFFPLPLNTTIRPWDPNAWGIRGKTLRDYDPKIPYWVTKNASGVVTIQGFSGIASAIAAGVPFAKLPIGFRPSTQRWFPALVSDVRTQLVVETNGDMYYVTAVPAGAYVSLANVIFHDIAQDLNWVPITAFLNTFAATNQAVNPVSMAIDSFGFVWTRGRVSVGSNRTDNAPMFNMPSAAYAATLQKHFNGLSDGNAYVGISGMATTVNYKSGSTGSYVSLDGIIWQPTALDPIYLGFGPGASSSDPLGTMNFFNAWVNYDSNSFSPVAFNRRTDGLVIYEGFIRSGTGAQIFIVPNAYMPLGRTSFARVANGVYGRFTIDPNPAENNAAPRGAAYVETGSNSWFSIDSLAYQSAQ